jgi:SulP family sulfate permease
VSTAAQWLRRALPATEWLSEYGAEDARGDLAAGLTVGVMLIPQGMAYAVLAGVSPIYGLYAALVPPLVYPLVGSSRHLAVGAVAVDMVIIAAGAGAVAPPGSPEYIGVTILLAALVGLTELAMGAARLGFLANLLSRPVIAGFTGAAALIILFSQLGNLLGVEVARTQYIHVVALDVITRVGRVSLPSLAVGLGAVATLVSLKRWNPLFPGELAVLGLGTLAAWGLDLGAEGVMLVGEVPGGLPAVALPALGAGDLAALGPTVLTLALVQFMSVVSVGRVVSARYRYTIDPNRELIGIGAANVLGSLFQSIPASGSFSRTAVNEQAGARTPLANVVAAALVALSLLFLTPLFRYLPMPVLAAIIMVAATGLVDVGELRRLFVIQPSDGWVALLTFLCTLTIGIQEGILVGITAAVIVILYRLSRPNVAELGHLPATRSFRNFENFRDAEPIPGILVLRVEAGFSFFNASFFKDFILGKSQGQREIRAVIIDGLSINFLDSTAVEELQEVVGTLREWGIEMHFTGLTGPVREVVERSGLGEFVGEDHFHIAPHYAVLDVLDRWDEGEGGNRAERYWRSTQQPRDEVEPTSESKFI